jgi:hypothetical protein
MKPDVVQTLVNQICWHVSAGGATVPSFQLVMGTRIPRRAPLENLAQPQEFRLNQGSHSLLVWCSWRLQKPDRVLATSDDVDSIGALDGLVGAGVVAVRCSPPAWDLELQFTNGLLLVVFCDNYGSCPSASRNWELWVPGVYVEAGLGGAWLEEPDEEPG